ncbi:MAG: hypothetical protein SPL28_01915 [Bacteroidales bacterium]|nr:hypothetical protein [Bacteroidales bacterium]
MKKLFLSLALVASLAGLSSCGGDEPYVPEITQETITAPDLINSTITIANNSVNYIETATYGFNIEYTDMREATVEVVANNVKFDSHMPFPVSFAMDKIKTYKLNDDYVEFQASTVKFLKPGTDEENTRYKLTNVRGYIDKRNKVYTLDYTVNDTWRVLVCNSTISSRVENNLYKSTTELYYTYDIDIATMKAEVFIQNVQFSVDGASSPVLPKISIPNLDVVATSTGFELSGDNIIPNHYSGAELDIPTPMPQMTVTNYHGTLNIAEGTHSIFFNSMGGEHNNTSPLYLWSWKNVN